MPQFGEVRVDFVTFTTGVSPSEANVTASVSGLIKNPTFSGDVVVKNDLDVEGNITISGTVTGNAAGFTSVTGTTVTGTTANFVTVSGTTVTGDTGNFTTATTTTANVTSGIFASGTAAAPSISVGTTDNGIYSPGSDQLAISTNGTGRLFIDSSGNVGIGVSSITNVANRSQLVIGGTDGGLIDLSHGSTAAEGRIFVNDGELALLAAESDGEIKFLTGGSNERFRIDNSGRLLVGTSSARTDLIAGTRGGRVQVEAASSTTGDAIDNSSLCLTMGHSGSTGSANVFFTRTKSNSLGGVTSVANNDILGGLYFQGTDGTDAVSAALIKAEVDGTPGANDMPGRIILATTADGSSSPTTRMTIDSSGNVGIGVTSNLAGSGDLSLQGNKAVRWTHATNGTQYADIYGDTSSNIVFRSGTGSTERMRMDSSGRLGIGTSSPSEILDAYGNIRFGSPNIGRIYSSDGSRGSIQISAPNDSPNRAVSYGNNYYLNSSGNWVQDSSVIGGSAIELRATNNNYGTFLFRQKQDPDAGGAERIPLLIDASGNVGIGTTSPANPLEINLESSATWTSGETLSNTTTNNNINALRLYNVSSAANAETSLLFMSGDSGAAQHSIAVVKTGNNAGDLVFRRRAITASAESLRIDNAGRLLVGTSSDSGGALLQVNDNRIRVATAKTPASASATGTTGEICWDASYVYVCTATNTWKRAALATW